MFFTSCLIIVFFCFAFYLIWDQFLKKDSRLSTGLKVLRKKTGELEGLSVKVDDQIARQLSLLQEKSKHFEVLIKKATQLNEQLNQHLKTGGGGEAFPSSRVPHRVESIDPKMNWLEVVSPPTPPSRGKAPPSHKHTEDKVIHFGRSPFKDLDPSP